MNRYAFAWVVLFSLATALIGGCSTPPSAAPDDDAGAIGDGAVDTGTPFDAGPPIDTGTPLDAGSPIDTGPGSDAAAGEDGSTGVDAAPGPDAAIAHHVVYDGNGATAGLAPLDPAAYFPGDHVTLADPGSLARTGFAFGGWSESTDGSGIVYAAGGDYVIGGADVLLHAVWIALPTYGVTYHVLEPYQGTVPTDTTRYVESATVTVMGSGDLMRWGASFDAWTTLPAGAGTRRPAGSTFAMPAADVDLYASWIYEDYTLTYDANGATSGTVPVDTAVYHFGDLAPVAGNPGGLARTGYTFVGWNTQRDGSGGHVDAGNRIELDASTTLYAEWEPLLQRITFDRGGGVAGSTGGHTPTTEPMDFIEAPTGATITLPANGFTRQYWAFAGWGTTPTGWTSYRDGASFVVPPGPVTLYAKWTVPLVAIAGGTFQRDTTAANTSTVSDYWIGTYEVTVDQMLEINGASLSGTPVLLPEHRATWYHALVFCNRMSLREGLTPVYAMVPSAGGAATTNPSRWGTIPTSASAQTTLDRWNAATADWTANGYRLPTEMEWLWAAMDRSPTGYTRRWPGDVGSGTVGQYGWVQAVSGGAVHPGGGLLPTALGIYDMAGNVDEYVWDRDANDYAYPNGALVDYHGQTSGQARRVIRGGSYYNTNTGLGEGYHITASPSVGVDGLGFRIARGHP